MATILGPRSLIDNAMPLGVDADVIMRFKMQEGMTPVEVISMAATTIGEANEYIASTYGGILYFTERLWARYRQGLGERRMTPKGSEFVEEDGRISERIGHMLYVEDYKDATSWSRDYLERAIREDLRDDILMKKEDWINRLEYEIFSTMFRSSEIEISTTSWSPPWAIATGTNLNYVPPQWRSNIFDNTHTHFIRVNSAATDVNTISTLDQMAKHLAHHGHLGMKVAYLGDTLADLLQGTNDKRFATYIPAEFRLLSGNTAAPVATMAGQLEGVPGEVIGYFSSKNGLVEIRRHDRVPANYIWMGKSYGRDNPGNSMAIRVWPGKGFGLMVNPQVDRSIMPTLDKVLFKGTHGVNVNERLNGVAAQIATGGANYVQPDVA